MIKTILLWAFLFSTHAMALGRYATTSLTHFDKIKAWSEQKEGRYWIKGEDQVFYYDEGSSLGRAPFGQTWSPLKGQLYFYYGAHALPKRSKELLSGGRIRLIESERTLALDFSPTRHGGIRPIRKNHQLIENIERRFSTRDSVFFSPKIDSARWRSDVETLAGWNRYSYGSEIEFSRLWLIEQFSALPGFTVSDYTFKLPRGEGRNVIARIEGRSRPDEIYIVGAHYDSTSERTSVAAPGAEDNASGTAGLLALARIFAEHPPEATIIFAAFSGEEQGLYGSKAWVKSDWLPNGKYEAIKAVFIMDMIGYSGDAELDLLLETSSLTKGLLADIATVNHDPDLVTKQSFDYWGSDHEPFLDNGIPAILFIEDDYLRYPGYHRTTDTMNYIHPTLGPKILQLMADSLSLWTLEAREEPENPELPNEESETPPAEEDDEGEGETDQIPLEPT